ncbi:MAG: hypothetical protein K6E34_00750 [Lachnospiraceae bacterium]|nr:hypothetical protein [Lachnospiraceae bacterium]
MRLFSRKENIIAKTEQQRDALIEKLEKAHIEYKIKENKKMISSQTNDYIIQIYAEDMKKVV